MSTSRSIDRLTYIYYTGQYLSEPEGPNCHKCMNDLFHEDKLLDVQRVFITTPKGVVQFPIRSLVFNYGREAPFNMTSFAEDHKDDTAKETERKRKIDREFSLEVDSDSYSTSSMAKRLKGQSEEAGHLPTNSIVLASDNIKLEARNLLIDCLNQIHKAPASNADLLAAKFCMEDSRDKDHSLPFQYGRNPADVEDPMPIDDKRSSNEFWKYSSRALKRYPKNGLVNVYFAKQEIFTCEYCDLVFQSSDCFNLIVHLLSKDHFSKVAAAGLVFSHSKDLQKLEVFSYEAFKEDFISRTPFVSRCRHFKMKMRFETIFNKLACLRRTGLVDAGFSQYMFLKYPNIKYINNCAICETPLFWEQNANHYLNLFLSPGHIVKATEYKWNISRDYVKFISFMKNYLHRNGRKEDAVVLAEKLRVAGNKKTLCNTDEECNHLFARDIIEQEW